MERSPRGHRLTPNGRLRTAIGLLLVTTHPCVPIREVHRRQNAGTKFRNATGVAHAGPDRKSG